MQTADALLDVRAVTVRFRRKRALFGPAPTFRAVAEASLTVGRRQVLALVGESGSGKTTLGRTILRLNEPAEGAIVFEGRDITNLRERALRPVWRRMALVFQDPLSSLNPRQTIGRALATPLQVAGRAGELAAGRAGDVPGQVAAALARVKLAADIGARYPHELSGGQLQRAALARALMLSPSFVVADEAVSKLDVSVRAQILNLLKDLQASLDVSFLFITHDLHVARYMADRIAVMFFGRIVESAPAAELFRAPRHPYTRALLATLADAGPAAASRGAVDQERQGCIYQAQCPRRLPRCEAAHPPTVDQYGHALACWNPG